MKTLILKILPLLLIAFSPGLLLAQTINTTAGSVTSCPAEIQVPIDVTNCNGVGAISLVLNYNTSILTYVGYQNLHPSLSTGLLIVHASGDKVTISWANTTAINPGNATLMKLRFNTVPGISGLDWDTQTPGNCEYSDVNGNILASSYTNGTATINQPPAITGQPTSHTIMVGGNTTFTVSASGAALAYQWQISTNGGTSYTDLTNNATYSNVNGTILYLTNGLITYNGYKYRCKVTGTCTPVAFSDPATLTVVNPVTTTLPTASSCPGNLVVPVTVTNFSGVASFSLTFIFNPAVLTYTGFQNLNGALSSGLTAINSVGGYVYMTWSSTSAVSFGNGTIVEIKFSSVSGNSSLQWDTGTEGACEYMDINVNPIPSVFINGSETIHYLPTVTSHPTNKTIAKGQNTTFGITATGTGLGYLWQSSSNGGSTWGDLANGGTYSNVTSNTLSVSNAQLALSGTQYRCKVTGTCTPTVYSNAATLTVLPNIITQCGTATGCPGQVVVPITVTDFIGVASFSLTLNFNTSVLTYNGYQNLNAAVSGGIISANAMNGNVYLTWSNTTGATIANGGTLLELKFTGVPGSSSLIWDTQTPGNCEYSDINGLVIFSTWNNGNATVNVPPAIGTHPVNKTIHAGGSTTFSVSATGTGLAYIWQVSTNGGSTWTNLTNVSPYSGVTTATLTINPAATGMNGYQYHCIVSGTCAPAVTSDAASLAVTQAAITTTPGAISNSCTGNINVPLNVVNCSNVGSFSMTLLYDTTKLVYEGYHTVNAGLSTGLLVVNRLLNKVYITWASTSALNIGSGSLLQLKFNTTAGMSTSLTWDTQTPGACEYADPSGTIITSFYNSGSISISASALVVDAGDDLYMTGSSVQLNGSATGGTTPYTWSWTPVTALSNPAIANPVASPTVTTTYTLTVTGNNGCSGSDAMNVILTIPENLSLQNITLSTGTTCYNATNTITVAGDGTTFVVQSGASAIMIAGQKILYLPGTTVQSGGYMHGYITTTGQYCNTLPPSMVATTIEESTANEVAGDLFSIYPNPTAGRFTVDLQSDAIAGDRMITLYGVYGNLIMRKSLADDRETTIDLSDQPSGIYFVRVVTGDRSQTRKVIRQ